MYCLKVFIQYYCSIKTIATILALCAFCACKKTPENNNSSVIFWQNPSTSNYAQTQGITSYKFYVEGKLVGTMPVTQSWSSPPECGSAGAVTHQVTLGEARSKSFNIKILDQDNSIIIDQDQTFNAGECLKKGL